MSVSFADLRGADREPSTAAGDKKRVLIVDDSALMRKLIAQILQSVPDFEVVGAARDGVDALEKARSLRPDVITLDVEMPNMDGLAFLDALMPTLPTPVVMLSSLTTEGAENDACLPSARRGRFRREAFRVYQSGYRGDCGGDCRKDARRGVGASRVAAARAVPQTDFARSRFVRDSKNSERGRLRVAGCDCVFHRRPRRFAGTSAAPRRRRRRRVDSCAASAAEFYGGVRETSGSKLPGSHSGSAGRRPIGARNPAGCPRRPASGSGRGGGLRD